MSVEELKADLEANTAIIRGLNGPLTTAPEIVALLQGTIWPFIENVVNELAEVDEGVHDLYSGAEDILQPETGAVFAAIIGGGLGLIAQLEARIAPNDPERQKLKRAIEEWKKMAKEGEEILMEIVVPDDPDEAEGDDAEGEEDDDEDEDDDDDDGEDDEDGGK